MLNYYNNTIVLNLEVQPYGEMKVKNSVVILGKLLLKHKGQYTLGVKLQQHIAATCRSDKSLRVCWRIFVKICLRNIILLLKQVAKNQIRQNLCDLLL